MFELPESWERPVNLVFLLVTGFIAVHGIRFRDGNGEPDSVRLLFACIAALFFVAVLFSEVFGINVFD